MQSERCRQYTVTLLTLQGGISLALQDDQNAEAPEKLLEAMRLTLQYSTCTSHPLFFNQLYGGAEPAGIAGTPFLHLQAL